jgi:hypothetical protein
MGTFLSQIMSKLLGGEKEAHNEVDHNNIICCGTVNILEPGETSDDEKELQKERKHGDKNIIH